MTIEKDILSDHNVVTIQLHTQTETHMEIDT